MSEQELFNDEGEPVDESGPDEMSGEVPEADAAEQTRPLTDKGRSDTDQVGDRPEADALEQDRFEDEDDEERR
jgi:hypothetical protein